MVEAGRSSFTMSIFLDGMGIDVAIAHPKEMKAIAKAKIKKQTSTIPGYWLISYVRI